VYGLSKSKFNVMSPHGITTHIDVNASGS